MAGMKGGLLPLMDMAAMGLEMPEDRTRRTPQGNVAGQGGSRSQTLKQVVQFEVKGEKIAALSKKDAIRIYNFRHKKDNQKRP